MPIELTLSELARRLGCADYVSDEPREMLTQNVAAQWLGITARAVRNLHELGFPKRGSGRAPRYPWPQCAWWFDAYTRRQGQPSYRRETIPLETALYEYQTSEWMSAPNEFRLIPRELFQALTHARIKIDAGILRRLERAAR